MKRISTSLVALMAASFFASASGATDLLDEKYDPAPAGVSVNWTGFYIGGQIGYGNANHDLTLSEFFRDYCFESDGVVKEGFDPFKSAGDGKNPEDYFQTGTSNGNPIVATTCDNAAFKKKNGTQPVDLTAIPGDSRDVGNIDGVNSHGVIGGGQIGYDQQVGSWVFGVFGNYNFSGMEATANGDFSLLDADSLKIEKDDEWTAGIRAGRLLSERTMLYGLIGYTQTDYLFTASPDVDGLKDKVTFDGVTFGAGLEHALTQNVFIGIEGTHTIYGEETIFDSYGADFNTGAKVTDDLSETRVMGTLKIKLNSF